jgi:shikimate dehydrogenase
VFAFDVSRLQPNQIVAEIIMTPALTPLLEFAQAKGCRIQYGLPMLECQIEMMADFMGVAK